MKFNIKDFNYIGIIIALLITFVSVNESNKHKSVWCNDFYNKFNKEL